LALTQVVWKSSGKLISLALLGGVALSTGGNAIPVAADAGSAPTLVTLDRQPLCRNLRAAGGLVRRCSPSWRRNAHGQIVSDDSVWVPADSTTFLLSDDGTWTHGGSDALYLMFRPVARAAPKLKPSISSSPRSSGWSGSSSAGPFGLWVPPPGHPAYALPDYAGDPNAALYGYCTWYAQYRRQDERLLGLGNAAQWAFAAPAHGLRVGYTPVVGATVVLQPGVLGAGAGGHVGHVEAVYTGGWFLISEMNMYWNGGGWGRVSFRYAVVASGVSFIY
jgi:hypothetical protein